MDWGSPRAWTSLALVGTLTGCASSSPGRFPANTPAGDPAAGVAAAANDPNAACAAVLAKALSSDALANEPKLRADVDRGLKRYSVEDAPQTRAAGEKVEAVTRRLYKVLPPTKWDTLLRKQIGERMRNWLMVANSHAGPWAALNEKPIAYAWAKAAYGEAGDAGLALLPNFDAATGANDLTKDLMALVTKVKSYQADLESLVNAASDTAMEIEVLERIVKEKEWPTNGFVVDIPAFRQGNEPKFNRAVYPDLGKANKRLIALRDQLRDIRSSRRFEMRGKVFRPWTWRLWKKGSVSARSYDQAITLLKLRTYYDMLGNEQTLKHGKALPAAYDEFMKAMEEIIAPDGKSWRAEFETPEWAKRGVRLVQIGQETMQLFSIFNSPRVNAMHPMQKLYDFVNAAKANQLSADEIKEYGFNRVPGTGSMLARLRPQGLIVTGLTSFTAAYSLKDAASGGVSSIFGAVHTYITTIFENRKRRETCVQTEDIEAFNNCAMEWLAWKYPADKLILAGKLDDIVSDDGQFTDPKMAKDWSDIKLDRQLFIAQERRKKNAASAMQDALRRSLENDDSLESVRQRLIETLDADTFFGGLTQPKGYIARRFKKAYAQEPKLPELVKLASTNKETRELIYQRLQDPKRNPPLALGRDLAGDLKDILEKHDSYVDSHQQSEEARKLVEETIKGVVSDAKPSDTDVAVPATADNTQPEADKPTPP